MSFWRIYVISALALAAVSLIGFLYAMASLNLKLFAVSVVLGMVSVGGLVAGVLYRNKGAGREEQPR